MQITQNTWGPYAWKFLHIVALAYPNNPSEEKKIKYLQFYTVLGDILPCSICSNHYKEMLINFPLNDIVLSCRENLLKWTIDIHNEVNKSLNKKVLTYDEAIILIKNNYEKSDNQITPINNLETPINNQEKSIENFSPVKKNSNMLYLLIFLFISLILIAVIYKKN
jgi:hypothetical protein